DAATPPATAATAQAGPCKRGNAVESTDGLPGPLSVSAPSAAISTALYSQPPLVTHGPLAAWTLRIAVVITLVSEAVASGVRAPSASSRPPPASAAPAISAWRRGG